MQIKADRKSKRRQRTVRLFLAALSFTILVFGAAVGYCLLTADGAETVTRFALAHYLGLRQITVGRVRGNVLEGFTVEQVYIPHLLRRSAGALDIAEASMVPLFQWHAQGPEFSARGLRLQPSPLGDSITAERAQGSVLGGIMFHEMRLSEVRRLPAGSTLDVQELDSAWPIGWRRLRNVQNARLRMPQSDTVVFFGRRQNDRVEARVFSKTLDVQEILALFTQKNTFFQNIQGIVNDLNVGVAGDASGWTFDGTFQVPQIGRQEVVIANSAGRAHLKLEAAPLRITGEVLCWGGTLTAKQVAINVRPSKVLFTGNPTAPALDLNGASMVGTTRIFLKLTGTKSSPQLILNSEPPMSQETLLLMLATGKSWRGAREAMAQGEVSSELATDFIDYVFFGGLGNRMARRFGITDFAITQNPENNSVGAQATFADRMMLDVEVDPSKRVDTGQTVQPEGSRQTVPYRVGAEYQVTDRTSVRIEGERNPIEQRSSTQTDPSANAKPAAEVDSTVLLKVKRQF